MSKINYKNIKILNLKKNRLKYVYIKMSQNLNEYITNNQFGALSLNVIKYLKKINHTNCVYKFNKKLCKNFLNNKFCRFYCEGRCKFAHSFFELDEYFQYQILKLGFEAYDYLYNNDLKRFKQNNNSLTQYIQNIKEIEIKANNEIESLTQIKSEYSLLIYYSYKLYKEQKIINQKNIKYNTINHNSSIVKLKNDMINQINDVLTCKICYKQIINDNRNTNIEPDCLEFNYNFITLSCGHSICDSCHVALINTKKDIYIKCPICRNDNSLFKTNPNYQVNEMINIKKFLF